MNNSNNISCESITKMNQESQNQKLRFFAKVDITTKLKILTSQKQLFHKLKSSYGDIDNTVLTLCSLILAIDLIVKELDNVTLNAIKLRGKNCKIKIKRQKVLGYWAIVRSLKLEQNMSFRNISAYFAKYHRLDVSYSTIFELWNKLEKKMENKNG